MPTIAPRQLEAGELLADQFIADNGATIDVIQAELDRLRWGQRDTTVSGWLNTREGSFYRSRLGDHLTDLRAAENRRVLQESDRQRREAERAESAKVRDNSVEARLDRIEQALAQRLGVRL